MTLKTPQHSYLYSYKYDYHNTELCKLESRQLFNTELEDKLLFSDISIDPSVSPFIKNKIQIISSSEDYFALLKNIKGKNIRVEGFKIEYLLLEGDTTDYTQRREKLKDIGYSIEGEPDFKMPSVTYAICQYQNNWYFGRLTKHNPGWHIHKKKPCSFSNSINMDIAKALVSIASKGNKTHTLLDACCGVGTIILEACFWGIKIEGCDISPNACIHTQQNLAHYDYNAPVYCSDIKDLNKKYDAAIIDLPYNLYSYSNDLITANIIESTAKLSTRLVIVSIANIENIIKNSGLKITDFCSVEKRGKSNFTRNIWVCEKESNT